MIAHVQPWTVRDSCLVAYEAGNWSEQWGLHTHAGSWREVQSVFSKSWPLLVGKRG